MRLDTTHLELIIRVVIATKLSYSKNVKISLKISLKIAEMEENSLESSLAHPLPTHCTTILI